MYQEHPADAVRRAAEVLRAMGEKILARELEVSIIEMQRIADHDREAKNRLYNAGEELRSAHFGSRKRAIRSALRWL